MSCLSVPFTLLPVSCSRYNYEGVSTQSDTWLSSYNSMRSVQEEAFKFLVSILTLKGQAAL